MKFYMGAHHGAWLERAARCFFVAQSVLAEYKTLPAAVAPRALDSNGFMELQMHGCWTIDAREYVARVRRFIAEVGLLEWASPQDWMCEPLIIKGGTAVIFGQRVKFAGTGLSVAKHQQLTLDNFRELQQLAPEVPWRPVFQGWTTGEYLDHREMYERAGVDLSKGIGIGSVCRRGDTFSVIHMLVELLLEGFQVHVYGFKIDGLEALRRALAMHAHVTGDVAGAEAAWGRLSADSMGWSYGKRFRAPCLVTKAKTCSNCLPCALDWAERIESEAAAPLLLAS